MFGSLPFHKRENFIEILDKQIKQCNNAFNGEKPFQIGLNIKRNLLAHINQSLEVV